MKSTNTASLESLREMRDRGVVKSPGTDAPSTDMPEGFWDTAQPQLPKVKKPISMRIDPDILEFFKEQGDGHLTRMHSVLRAYVDAHRKDRSTGNLFE